MAKDERWHRWDHAWKIFLSDKYPWHKQFIAWLVGDVYRDYVVNIDEREFHSDNVDNPVGSSETSADCILSCEIDKVAKKLHFEFQSTYDKSIALRALQYQLDNKVSAQYSKEKEIYILPDTVVVAVRSGVGYRSPRELELHLNSTVVRIPYPVVKGYLAVPGLQDVMDAKDENALRDASIALCMTLNVPRDNVEVRNRLLFACSLIAHEDAYSPKGVKEDIIMADVKKVAEEFKTIEGWAEERGREEGRKEGRQEGRQETEFEYRTKFEAALQGLGYSPEEAELAVDSVLAGKGFPAAKSATSNVKRDGGSVTDLKYPGQK